MKANKPRKTGDDNNKVEFGQTRIVQLHNFELFDKKKWLIILDEALTPFWKTLL